MPRPASASPRRKALLEAAGVACTVIPADIDETPEPGETPSQHVRRLARAKALEVARCLELFTKMMLNMEPSPLAWEGYIVEHGIQRHFREDIDVGAQQAS